WDLRTAGAADPENYAAQTGQGARAWRCRGHGIRTGACARLGGRRTMTPAKDTGSGNPLPDPRRERSEGITVEAEAAWRDGQHAQARKLFAGAAAIEEDVAREAAVSFPRARS